MCLFQPVRYPQTQETDRTDCNARAAKYSWGFLLPSSAQAAAQPTCVCIIIAGPNNSLNLARLSVVNIGEGKIIETMQPILIILNLTVL